MEPLRTAKYILQQSGPQMPDLRLRANPRTFKRIQENMKCQEDLWMQGWPPRMQKTARHIIKKLVHRLLAMCNDGNRSPQTFCVQTLVRSSNTLCSNFGKPYGLHICATRRRPHQYEMYSNQDCDYCISCCCYGRRFELAAVPSSMNLARLPPGILLKRSHRPSKFAGPLVQWCAFIVFVGMMMMGGT